MSAVGCDVFNRGFKETKQNTNKQTKNQEELPARAHGQEGKNVALFPPPLEVKGKVDETKIEIWSIYLLQV